MNKVLLKQDYSMYTEEDHATWAQLNANVNKLHDGRISQAFIDSFHVLKFDQERIVRIDELSKRMEAISGWTLVPVSGLVSNRDFFYMLVNKVYPITVYMRKPWEIEFSEQPDIFHDIYGHLPLLMNEKFMQFIAAYSKVALKYADDEQVVEYLGRLYWYTYEMGLIIENGAYKPYGAAIITSASEIENSNSTLVPKHMYAQEQIFNTAYNPFDLQKEYFVINSFDQLCESMECLEESLLRNLSPTG
jgi:monomeric phenylalanine-4-hydroxylase